jgi:gluconolactonase
VIRKIGIALLVLLVSTAASGQRRGGGPPQPPAPKEVVAPAIPGVVAAGTKIELVAFPVASPEGSIGLPDGSGILFCERPAHIAKIDASGKMSTFVENGNASNGLAWDSKGRLIAVQRPRGAEKVGVLYPAGSVATLVDNFEGKPFNGLNDLVVSTKDGIYFTDTEGVYYLAPGAPGSQVKKVIQDIENPNGVQLSPDEKTLYANDKDGEYLLAFDVQPDGSLKNRRNFGKYKSLKVPGSKDPRLAEDNGADGLAIDGDGRVYVATNLGVEVFSPRGQHLGVIPIGVWGSEQTIDGKPANLTFAGPDKKTLYAVGSGAVYRVQLLAQGFKGRGK